MWRNSILGTFWDKITDLDEELFSHGDIPRDFDSTDPPHIPEVDSKPLVIFARRARPRGLDVAIYCQASMLLLRTAKAAKHRRCGSLPAKSQIPQPEGRKKAEGFIPRVYGLGFKGKGIYSKGLWFMV